MIALPVTASVTEFLGYDDTVAEATPTYSQTGKLWNVPTVSPVFDEKETTASVNLWDGQTLVLKLSSKQIPTHTAVSEAMKSKIIATIERDTLILVTADIVDRAGNRFHTQEEAASHKDTIPSQPPPAFSGQLPGASN